MLCTRGTARLAAHTGRCLAFFLASSGLPAASSVQLRLSAERVGRYEKVEFVLGGVQRPENPSGEEKTSVSFRIQGPDRIQVHVPAFWYQGYQYRTFSQRTRHRTWLYPKGSPHYRGRWAPPVPGKYRVRACVRRGGTKHLSSEAHFVCVPSDRTGYLRVSRHDPRFFSLSAGQDFFALGQNLAFIGDAQYVSAATVEGIFQKLNRNGANYARIWACCKDWACAVEAPKSAWARSWSRGSPVVLLPEAFTERPHQKAVRLSGPAGTSIPLSPSHPLGLAGTHGADLWFFNPEASWVSVVLKKGHPAAVTGTTARIALPDGAYKVTFRDPHTGKVIDRVSARARNGDLVLALPPFSWDVACTIRR